MEMIWKRIRRLWKSRVKKSKAVISEERDAGYLYDMLSGQILQHAQRIYGLSGKNLHVVLMDEDVDRTELVLRQIYEPLNYLTIVTRNQERFEELAEDICYETGLSIGFAGKIPEYADLILEPSRGRLQTGGKQPGFVEFDRLQFCLDERFIDSFDLQKLLWGENIRDLRQFGTGEIPEEYAGRIDIRGLKRV